MGSQSYLHIENIDVQVVRKKIKNFHLRVYPPEGILRISAPVRATDAAVAKVVREKMPWILKHKERLEQQEQNQVLFVTGEQHLFLGKKYSLVVLAHTGRIKVELQDDTLILHIHEESTNLEREKAVDAWYRKELQALIPPLLTFWQGRMQVIAKEWRIKKMKTKWGTCNIRAARIWLNLELAKMPVPCLEYVLVHELVHLFERHHNQHFKDLMTKFLPEWQENKKILHAHALYSFS